MSDTSAASSDQGTAAGFEPFHATGLAASITVNDLPKTVAWYRDVLGFTEGQTYEYDGVVRGMTMIAGNVRLIFSQDDGAAGWDRVKGLGLSLQFATEQSVDRIADRIRDQGVAMIVEPTDMPWGARLLRIKDPDGFVLSISQPIPVADN